MSLFKDVVKQQAVNIITMTSTSTNTQERTCTQRFNGQYPGEPG